MRIFYRRRSLGPMLIVISIVFFTFGIKNAADKSVPESYYTTVNAVIIEKYQSPIAELESFADVSYTDLSGIERTGRIEYNGSANVGDVIQIDMSTHNPELIGFATPEAATRQTAEKSQNKRYAAIEIAVGVLLFALGIFLTVRRMKARRVPEETTVPPAETVGTVPVSETRDGVSNYEIERIFKKIDEKILPKPMVKLVPSRSETELSVFENKLGGVPYMPADFEYPKGKSGIFEGRPLRLLAQLNFEKLPHIENFPEKGILQFFCSDDDEESAYGLDFDNAVSQNGFRVIYHENIIADESRLMQKESMPNFTDSLGNFPFKGEFLLEAEAAEMCPVSASDYHFENAVLEQWSRITGKKYNSSGEADGLDYAKLWEKLHDVRACEHTCIGGYPFFTQTDSRDCSDKMRTYSIMLFQCSSSYEDNSEDEIMWGDMGVANFFITEKDLKKRDFSSVAYNWDCC